MDEQASPENSPRNNSEDEIRTGGDGADPSQSAQPVGGEDEEISRSKDASIEDGFVLAPEELPTMQWSDVYAELAEFEDLDVDGDPQQTAATPAPPRSSATGPLDGLEDAMNWLEELAAGQGMPIDEMPTLVSAKPSAGELLPQEESTGDHSGEESGAPALDVDSDPMAWLEQLAVDQSSPLEELPSVADRLLASEIVSQTELPPNSTINDPYDVDEALNYLEQVAVSQGVDLDGISFDADQPLDSLKAALAIVDGLALTGLAARSAAFEKEVSPVENGDGPDIRKPQLPGDQLAEIDAVEEGDMTVDEIVDIVLLPEEDDGAEPPESDQVTDLSAEMPDDPHQALDWLGTMGEADDDPSMTVVDEEDTLGPQVETPAADQPEEQPVQEKPQQEDDGAQLDSDVLEEMPDDPDEAVAWMEHLARQGSHSSKSDEGEPSSAEERPSPVADTPPPDQAAALAALASDDLDQAFGMIQGILDDEAATTELVAALENAVDQHQESPRLLRFLGDAYMQVGEVDKAIASYRKGFDHL